MIHIDIDKDAEECAQRVVSNAYDESDWCEDGSIRQNIKDLTSNLLDMDEDMQDLKEAIKLIKNSLFVIEGMLKIHDQKIDVLVKGGKNV